MSRNSQMSGGLLVEESALDPSWLRVREKADLTNSGVLVSRQRFSAFMASALAGEVRPEARNGLVLIEIGDLAETGRWVVTTEESWAAFLDRAHRGELDDYVLRRM